MTADISPNPEYVRCPRCGWEAPRIRFDEDPDQARARMLAECPGIDITEEASPIAGLGAEQ